MPENNDTDINDTKSRTTVSIDELVSDTAKEKISSDIDTHPSIAPVLIPPVPVEKVDCVTDDTDLQNRLWALTDLARAYNRAVDPAMPATEEWDDDRGEFVPVDPPWYPLEAQSVSEVKVATRLLYMSYQREIEAIATQLGVANDPEYVREHRDETGYDYNSAIADALGYEYDYDYERSLRRIASTIDVSPAAVADALRDRFGDDVDQLTVDTSIDTTPLDDLVE